MIQAFIVSFLLTIVVGFVVWVNYDYYVNTKKIMDAEHFASAALLYVLGGVMCLVGIASLVSAIEALGVLLK